MAKRKRKPTTLFAVPNPEEDLKILKKSITNDLLPSLAGEKTSIYDPESNCEEESPITSLIELAKTLKKQKDKKGTK